MTLLLIGAAPKSVGNDALMVAGRLETPQPVFCLGSSSVVGSRVGSQASVPREDLVAAVASIVAVGASVGAATAPPIWIEPIQTRLGRELPGLAVTEESPPRTTRALI